ncbi:hypothetical protein A2645_00725 [Candidatus Nomurabacteria bacterium RIFCSPHIGHO2_01_FULL_39_9]|uniref:Uncharacterized protein n=1 Tax=Candidatus Nomurabacteria bacterium RIFCSPHIGHO2_01_FULL_39_9 TaxID=1801735 RepID=A0A1F6UW57_9BACT|nr:MAG: hypothetical protein A2645_00725 [Candidatus Nomurabacteria bacterium RIFCSPHIGHO2_01_FULL_39_9]
MKKFILAFALVGVLSVAVNSMFRVDVPKIGTGKPFTTEDGRIVLTGFHTDKDTVLVWFEITEGAFGGRNEIYRTIPLLVYGVNPRILSQIGRPAEAKYSFRIAYFNPKSVGKEDVLFKKEPYTAESIFKNRFINYSEEESFTVVDANKN